MTEEKKIQEPRAGVEYSPELRLAMLEITQIAEARELAIVVAIVSPEHGEFAVRLPAWTGIRMSQESTTLEEGAEKSEKAELAFHALNSLAFMVDGIRLRLGQAFKSVHGEFSERIKKLAQPPRPLN